VRAERDRLREAVEQLLGCHDDTREVMSEDLRLAAVATYGEAVVRLRTLLAELEQERGAKP
jgi:hypothetical protein